MSVCKRDVYPFSGTYPVLGHHECYIGDAGAADQDSGDKGKAWNPTIQETCAHY